MSDFGASVDRPYAQQPETRALAVRVLMRRGAGDLIEVLGLNAPTCPNCGMLTEGRESCRARHAPTAVAAPKPEPASGPFFSDRERQVLSLIAEGLTARAAAERMGVSPHTVKTHLDRMRDRHQVDRAGLLRLAGLEAAA